MSNILAFAESWSGYTTNTGSTAAGINNQIILARWTNIDAGGVFFIRNDGVGNYNSIGASVNIYKTVNHQTGYTIGFRVRIELPGSYPVLTLYNNNTQLGNVTINIDGTIGVYGQSSGSSLIAISNSIIHANTWYYFELSVSLSGTTPINVAAILRVNGEELVNGNVNTAVNTVDLTSQNATVNRFSFAGQIDIRDIYANAGASNFDGDIKILAVRPNADVVSNWVCSSGTSEFALVNETFSDFDASYVSQTATGSQGIWGWEDIPTFSGTIKGIQISIIARKDDEGSKSFEIVTGSTGTETASPEFYLADSYVAYFHCQDDDPATSVPYTVTGFNAKDFGIKLIK